MKTNNNRKVLLVDDEIELLKNVSELLELENYKVKKFTDAREAIKAYAEEDFDIIISDLRMPNCSGVEFLEILKENKDKLLPPFIFISGFTELTKEEAIERGAKDILKKPFSIDDFLKVIQKYMQ